MSDSQLTTDEIAVNDAIIEVVNGFGRLEVYHRADMADVVFHIHALQNILMSRIAVRTNPELFPKRP